MPDLKSVAPLVFAGQSVQQSRDRSMIVPSGSWKDYFTGSDDPGRYGVQSVWASFEVSDSSVWLSAVRDRLQAAGWEYRGAGSAEYPHSLWATRGGYAVEVDIDDPLQNEPVSASAVVMRTSPWWMTVTTSLAGIAGAFAGWFFTGWVSRRTENCGRLLRTSITTMTSIALVMMVAHAMAGLGGKLFIFLLLARPTAPPWAALFELVGWQMFLTSLALTAVIVALAMIRPKVTDSPLRIAP
ncbi:hypothetical protein [Actinoplanes sp. TFC3]|uniref:hypothetical protein n=1 Tax=Actinoplanes sp. TFC3 TaxID=1710355 RepID=UPI0012902AAE|nr:hypothetical protein [Actinoplanes sp. TFC3]